MFLYVLVAIVDLVWGLNYAAAAVVNGTDWVMGIMAAVIGVFCLYRTVTKVNHED